MHQLFSMVLIILSLVTFQAQAGRAISSAKGTSSGTPSSYSASESGGYFLKSDQIQEVVLSGTRGYLSSVAGKTNLSLSGMYGRFFLPHVEGALDFNFENSDGGTFISIYFLGIYNFQADYANSYFAFGGLGLNSFSPKGGSSTSNSGMKFGGGKRIQFWGPVSLMPIAWMQKDGSADMVTNIMPLNFSILF